MRGNCRESPNLHKDLVTLSMENNTYDINTAIEYCYVAANQIN